MCVECQTAACIGPHHRGKKGSSCRTGGSGTRGSARFRPGMGERERSESAMGANSEWDVEKDNKTARSKQLIHMFKVKTDIKNQKSKIKNK